MGTPGTRGQVQEGSLPAALSPLFPPVSLQGGGLHSPPLQPSFLQGGVGVGRGVGVGAESFWASRLSVPAPEKGWTAPRGPAFLTWQVRKPTGLSGIGCPPLGQSGHRARIWEAGDIPRGGVIPG